MSFGVAFMRTLYSTNYAKHMIPAKFVFSAKLSQVVSAYYRSVWGNYRKFEKPLISYSPLIRAVSHIVFLRSQKKMVRSNTFFIVAMMANIKGFIESAVSKLISKPMGHMPPAGAVWPMAEYPISIGINNTLPLPTPLSFINFFPKSLIYRFVATHEWIIAYLSRFVNIKNRRVKSAL